MLTNVHVRPLPGLRVRLACALVGSTLVALLLSGCTRGDANGDPGTNGGFERSHHGPLVTELGGGGNSIYPPEGTHDDWTATFGGLLICSAEPVTITDVVPHFKAGHAATIGFLIRTVPAIADRQGAAIHWAPVGTSTDTPSALAQSGDVGYDTLLDAAGTTVDQACSPTPDASYTEVLTTMRVGRTGAWIDRLDIQYTTGDTTYDLPVHWSYVACGTGTATGEAC